LISDLFITVWNHCTICLYPWIRDHLHVYRKLAKN